MREREAKRDKKMAPRKRRKDVEEKNRSIHVQGGEM